MDFIATVLITVGALAVLCRKAPKVRDVLFGTVQAD